jgi:hypothetical protein
MEIDMRESKLDPKAILDPNNWALSLICCKGNNHAQIVIEKITDDYKYVMQFTHFRGMPAFTVFAGNKGKVMLPKEISPDDLKYDGRRTWPVPRKKVEKMIADIESEYKEEKLSKSGPELFDSRTEFNLCGEHSIMPASVEETLAPVLDPITPHSSSDSFSKSFSRSYSLAMLITAAGLSIFTANPLPIITFLGVSGTMKLDKKLKKSINKKSEDKNLDLLLRQIRPHAHSFSSLHPTPITKPLLHSKYETSKRQHNCFTWAREKLKIAGIPPQELEGNWERLGILTRTYTNPGECPIKKSCS